jgi:hypothetical protein
MLNNPCAAGQRYFVDNYNAEYSRDIEPMKGGHGDNYYYQMVATNRLRKGVRPVPFASPPVSDGVAVDFSNVSPAYYDAPDETLPRDAPSTFSNLPNYTNTTGRNDFRTLKVARDSTYLYFMAETKDNITAATGANWMNLFIDVDCSRATGWEGYDYVINQGGSGQVRRLAGSSWTPTSAGNATVTVIGNRIVIRVARATLGLGADPLKFDFKWADNYQTAGDLAGFSTSGDCAPERRFNYRYQTAPEQAVVVRQDGFENGQQASWGETFGTGSQWQIASTTPYGGSKCLVGTGKTATTDASGTLINRAGTAGLSSMRIAFRYKLANVRDAQNIRIYYRNTVGTWVSMRELSRDEFHASGQAWGYDERQNVWLYYSDARTNSGADAVWFHSNFAVHIQIKDLTQASQTVAIDDFEITGIQPITAPTAASSPAPAHNAAAVPTTTGLSWLPGNGGQSQTLFFGTAANLQQAATLTAAANIVAAPFVLAPGTTYFWRINTENAAGITPGPVWTFTTAIPPNTPPALGGIGDFSVVAGTIISFAASATDPDLPLTFSLQGGPAGASIDPASGAFVWRPSQSQAPGIFPITVVVTDSGSPPLSGQKTFAVQVLKPAMPKVVAMTLDPGGVFRFQITADNGPDYRVWVSENLTNWEHLRTIVQPVSPFWFEDADAYLHSQRFYRLEAWP